MSKQKKSPKEQRKLVKKSDRRHRRRRMLKDLEIWEQLKNTTLVERLLNAPQQKIEIRLGASEYKPRDLREIVRELKGVLNRATFPCTPLGNDFLVQDFFTNVKPMLEIIHRAESRAQMIDVQSRTEQLNSAETFNLTLCYLWLLLDGVVAKYTRIDTFNLLLNRELLYPIEHGICARFTLVAVRPERHIIESTKPIRSAFRCRRPCATETNKWIEWSSTSIGIPCEPRQFPVLVQGHALDNLYRREARALLNAECEWEVHNDLCWSLALCRAVKSSFPESKFLVEFHFRNIKVGYLVARKLENAVLIETFLFLTMDGTPEGNALRQKLGLSKEDKIYTGLDKIHTYVTTDVPLEVVPSVVEIGGASRFALSGVFTCGVKGRGCSELLERCE